MKKIIVFVLILIIFGVNSANSSGGMLLSKKHDGVIYKIELSADKKADKICVLLYKNRDIQEVYNIVIENSDKFPIFPDSFRVDDKGNRRACFRFSAVSDNFSLYVIKFDSETLAADVEFPNIDLFSIPDVKNLSP